MEDHLKWYNSIKGKDYFFVIDLDGEPIGTICLYNFNKNYGEYGRFIIDRKCRGLRYGRDAMSLLISYARTLGIETLYGELLANNTYAILFDISIGFRITGLLRRNKRLAVRMEYDLLAA